MKPSRRSVRRVCMGLACGIGIAWAGLPLPASAQSSGDGEPAAVSAAYRTVVETLLDELGATQLVTQMMNSAIDIQLQALRDAGKPVTPELEQAVRETLDELTTQFSDRDTFVSMVTPIYARHFTQSELEEILAFYRTPVGAKSIRAMPSITAESMAAGQQIAAELLPRLEAKLLQRLQAAQATP